MTYLRPGRGSIRKYLQKERKGQSQKQKDMIISILRLADNHEVNINQSRLKPSLKIIIIAVISASSQLNIFLVKDFSFKFLKQKFLRTKISQHRSSYISGIDAYWYHCNNTRRRTILSSKNIKPHIFNEKKNTYSDQVQNVWRGGTFILSPSHMTTTKNKY